MAKRSARQRLADIYDNIGSAQRYVSEVSFEQFKADDEKQQAVLHRLQNASEATIRLKTDWPEEYARLELSHPDLELRMFRDLGNRYRHGYDQINLDLVWSDLHGYTAKVQQAVAAEIPLLGLNDQGLDATEADISS